ncbi:MAG: phospholipase [Saprospirales bacterium]|nr:phospholipase [Saprospirales bacterium]
MEEHKRLAARTARYYTMGKPGPEVQDWWWAFHGYGQLAGSIIRKFEGLESPENFILAPEGLSRFYWQGFDGQVGASWMTREDRLSEIDDYCRFFQDLWEEYRPQLPSNIRLHLLGFSQGVPTLLRWVLRQRVPFSNLILWAGMPPDDPFQEGDDAHLQTGAIHFVCGEKDPYFNPERLGKVEEWAKLHQTPVVQHFFDGVHEVDRAVLKTLSTGFMQA